jgi:ABC-type branched-subunit amino acid transport system substrate-binding protein
MVMVTACGNREPYDRLRADSTAAYPVTSATAPAAQTAPGNVPGTLPSGHPALGAVPAPALASAPTNLPGTRGTTAAAGTQGPKTPAPGPAPSCPSALPTIRIGTVGHNSGVIGAVFGGGSTVLKAWAQWVNASGGINCHSVQVFVGDDNTDPAVHLALVKRFVEQEGVVAFVFINAPLTGASSVDYLRSKNIPVFGTEGGSEYVNQNANYFPQMSSARAYVESTFAMAGTSLVPQGLTRLASVTCLEIQICSDAYAYVGEVAAKYGMTLVYRGQVSITQPSYTSSCVAAKNAGAQIIFTGMDGNSDQRLARSCSSVGLKAVIITPAVGLNPQQAAAPDLSGIHLAMPVAPWFERTNKAVTQYLEVMAKYAPGTNAGAIGVEAWTAALVFGFAASKAGPHVTNLTVLQGAFQVKNNDFGGITGPLTYRATDRAHPQGMCWWGAEIDGNSTKALNNGKRTCS